MRKNILVVSSDNTLNSVLCRKIEQRCVNKVYFEITNGHLGMRLNQYCLVVLNIPKAEEKYFALLHRICVAHAVPILVVSESDNVFDKVSALRLGADGYLISPFENMELIAQVHALIRRYTVFNDQREQSDLLHSNDLD